MKTITIFTPTYNRAYCLHQLYDSLCRQTSQDFLWLLIDDGSTDITKQLVELWISEGKIEIQYKYKENGGMHTGHNAAYEIINTELNVCIDSDDYMPDDAIKKIITLWRKYGSNKYAGLIGLDESVNKIIIGTIFPESLKECTYGELAPKYGVVGDKKIIYRTDIIKSLKPYPTFENEKFVPLYYPIIIDKNYKLLSFNEVFCTVDYQLDGSTLNIYNQYFKYPRGFSYSRIIEMDNLPFTKQKFKSAIHYIVTNIISKNIKSISQSQNKKFTIIAIPFGIVFFLFLLYKKNKIRDISKYVK